MRTTAQEYTKLVTSVCIIVVETLHTLEWCCRRVRHEIFHEHLQNW
jgi:hypothetical protein